MVMGIRMRSMSRMPTMSLLVVMRVISACSREIGVGNGKKKSEDDYMNADIYDNKCQVVLMQEVEPLFWRKMEKVQQENAAVAEERGEVADKKPLFIGFRGDEGPKDSLLIAGRPGVVLGIRIIVLHKILDVRILKEDSKRLHSAG